LRTPLFATVTTVFGGLNRLLAGALVAGAALTVVLAGPSSALACNGGTSAVNVYKECLPSGGGGKPSKRHHHSARTSRAPTSKPSGNPYGEPSVGSSPTKSTSKPATHSSATVKAIRHAPDKDRRALAYVESTGPVHLSRSTSVSATAPSAVGSAFDLGSGPTALLIALAGAAVLLLAVNGVRGFRHRHR
jgi:hypothetical protein